MEKAADAAAACGYEHVAVLQGSLPEVAEFMNDQVGAIVRHQPVIWQSSCQSLGSLFS